MSTASTPLTRGGAVDAGDPAPGDGRAHNAQVREARSVEIGGILGVARDLGDAVDAGRGGANVFLHGALSGDLLVGLRLRGAACGLAKRASDGAASKVDFEGVVPKALGLAQEDISACAKGGLAGRLAGECRSAAALRQGLCATPPSASAPPNGAVELDADRNRDQCEGIDRRSRILR